MPPKKYPRIFPSEVVQAFRANAAKYSMPFSPTRRLLNHIAEVMEGTRKPEGKIMAWVGQIELDWDTKSRWPRIGKVCTDTPGIESAVGRFDNCLCIRKSESK